MSLGGEFTDMDCLVFLRGRPLALRAGAPFVLNASFLCLNAVPDLLNEC